MGRIGLAFKVLFSKDIAGQLQQLLSGQAALPAPHASPAKAKPQKPTQPARSEATTLLATLQRDARFLDFVNETLDAYSDAQVGAAAREVHRGCGSVIERVFGAGPIVDAEDGSPVEIGDNAAKGRYRLTGDVAEDSAAGTGTLQHHGWEATRCDIPKWTGNESAVNIIAPAEVQV